MKKKVSDSHEECQCFNVLADAHVDHVDHVGIKDNIILTAVFYGLGWMKAATR